jgi:hypothetical protein
MTDRRQIIPVAGLVATMAGAGYMVVQLHAQTRPAGDFSNAVVAEVHDAQGRAVLRGQFALTDEQDDDTERAAELTATGVDADARGDAEVEVEKDSPAQQEIEFNVANLEPGMRVTFVIDGEAVGQATVNRSGRAELEVEIGQ